MHPLEARQAVGTGRIAHRCLENSQLWIGTQFGSDSPIADLIRDPAVNPLLMFPGPNSLDLEGLEPTERSKLLNSSREPVLIVLDATWSLAKKMLRLSPVLHDVPRVSFVPRARSAFVVRRQPRPECLSSLEAIHRVLCLLDRPEPYVGMLRVFQSMVTRQLSFSQNLP